MPVNDADIARRMAQTRIGFGVGMLTVPGFSTRVWLGSEADTPATRTLMRALGVRDLVLGVGTIKALDGGGGSARGWMEGAAVADAVDAAASLIAVRTTKRRLLFVTVFSAAYAAYIGFRVASRL